MLETRKMRKERASARSKVRMYGMISALHQKSRGRIVDLSRVGLALDLETPIRVMPGQVVDIESDELGQISGTVRWHANGRIGIEYKLNTKALAQVSSYFRFFHREVMPVLRG